MNKVTKNPFNLILLFFDPLTLLMAKFPHRKNGIQYNVPHMLSTFYLDFTLYCKLKSSNIHTHLMSLVKHIPNIGCTCYMYRIEIMHLIAEGSETIRK